MSEYQYYEFRAIDRPLTSQEMASLRTISSRARITSTSFVNVYNYGDFRGDPEALLEKCFDAFLYVANWGAHHLMLRLPKKAFGSREWAPFCAGDNLRAQSKGKYLILSFRADELETDWEEGEGWMDALLPIREDLLRGDFRALYLGWLLALQNEEMDDDQPEPPLPPGLRNPPAALRSLAEFLDLDPDLFEAAAQPSADLETAAPSRQHPRTAGELRVAADRRRKERERREAERRRLELERKERERAAERTKHLDALEERETESWDQLEPLIATKHPNDYDRAVALMADLRDLAVRKGCSDIFQDRLRDLRARHARKPSFIRKLNEAGLEL